MKGRKMLLKKKTITQNPTMVATLDMADWKARFEERAAHLEHEELIHLKDAERRAGAEARLEWMKRNVPQADGSVRCAYCNEMLDHTKVPARVAGDHARVHANCLAPFLDMLIRKADQAMIDAGFPKAATAIGPNPSRLDQFLAKAFRDFRSRFPKKWAKR